MRVSSVRMNPAEGLVVALAAAVTAIAIIGLALWVVTTPPVVHALVRAMGADRTAGISSQAAHENAEAVRRFVVDRSAPLLPSVVEGAPGFDEAAVSHLIDVREVLIPARLLTLAVSLVVAIWTAFGLRWNGRMRYLVGRSFIYAGVGLLAAGTLALAVGSLDFGSLFTWFHGLFFADGTWTFPDSALLIRIFPLPFWIAAGALWGVLTLGAAGALVLAGRSDYFTASTDGV